MITTKTGDDGKSRFSGKVVSKDSDLLEVVGTLDEVQSMIEDEVIQKDIYEIMASVSGYEGDMNKIRLRISELESETKKIENKLPENTFFLIFKTNKGRNLNIVRTVCRRAERRLVTLSRSQQIDPNILIYINRLSDYLFMLSRKAETG